MDLSFRLPDPAAARELPAADMAQLLAMLAQQQAASPTARVQAVLQAMPPPGLPDDGAPLLAPADGAFSAAMAARLAAWRGVEAQE